MLPGELSVVFYKSNIIISIVYQISMSLKDGDGGIAVACWTTDYYHPCSNVGVGISEGRFICDFAALRLELARPI